MFFKKRRLNKKINMFDTFIRGNWFSQLTSKESKNNIEGGLVEIMQFGHHSSNGLLISEDGYFITAKHCLDLKMSEIEIKTSDGKIYSLEKKCIPNKKDDLALAKVKIPRRCFSKKYNFFNEDSDLNSLNYLVLLSRWDGKLLRNFGNLQFYHGNIIREMNTKEIYYNHFSCYGRSEPGFSGSPIVNNDGKLMGLLSGGNGKMFSGIKLYSILNFISCN